MAAAKRLLARLACSPDAGGVGLAEGARPLGGEGSEAPLPELPQDIHTYAVLVLLADNAEGKAGIWAPLYSLWFVFAQLVLLMVICSDTCSPRCTEHGQCAAGQWCGPTYSTFGLDPGLCVDCFEAYAMRNCSRGDSAAAESYLMGYFSIAPRAAAPRGDVQLRRAGACCLTGILAAVLGEERLAAAVGYCDSTDTMPNHCDIVFKNWRVLSGGSLLVLWVTVAMVAVSVMEDMNEAGVSLALLTSAVSRSRERPPSRVVLALFWCIFTTRLFLLPVAVTVTTTAVLVTGTQSATNILMNGLVLTVVVTLDDVVQQLLPPGWMRRVEAAASVPLAAACLGRAGEGHWRGIHTGMAMVISGLIPIICVNVNSLLSIGLLNPVLNVGRLCSGLPAVLLRITMIGAVVMSFLKPVIWWQGPCLMAHLLPSWDERLVITIDALLSPLFNMLVLGFVIFVGASAHMMHIP